MTEWFYDNRGTRSGPLSDAEMHTLTRQRTISDHTLVWCAEFGSEWKSLDESGLLVQAANGAIVPPPLPRNRINNFFAFLYALVPLIGTIIEMAVKDNSDSADLSAIVAFSCLACYAILAFADCKLIARSGYRRASDRLNFGWFLLAPVYLWKRATYLRTGRYLFWLMILSLFGSGVLTVLEQKNSFFIVSVPQCNSSSAIKEAKVVFDSIPLNKLAGVSALAIDQAVEISSSATSRTCHGRVLTSSDQQHNIEFGFSKRDSQIYVNVKYAD